MFVLSKETHTDRPCNTQSHGRSYKRGWGRPWHRRTTSQPSEVPQGDLLQAHDSFGFSGQSKGVQTTSSCSSIPSLSRLRCSPPALLAEVWERPAHTSACFVSGLASVFFGGGGVISALPVPVCHPEEGSGLRSCQPVETSVASNDDSRDADCCDLMGDAVSSGL